MCLEEDRHVRQKGHRGWHYLSKSLACHRLQKVVLLVVERAAWKRNRVIAVHGYRQICRCCASERTLSQDVSNVASVV